MNYILIISALIVGVLGGSKNERQELLDRIQSLEQSMERTRSELKECYRKLETPPESMFGKAMTSLGSCFTSPPDKPFKTFVSEVLKILDIKEETSVKSQVTKNLKFSAYSKDVQTIRRFVLYDDVSFHEVQEILLNAFAKTDDGENWFSGLDTVLAGAGGKISPKTAQLIMAGLMVCVVLLPLCLGARKRIIILLLSCICIVHVWLGEYWKAVAKKEATLAKLGPNMKSCRLEKRGYAHAVSEFFNGLFNGVDDPCEQYYRAAMVDPIFEVNLLHALVESLSQLMGILGGVGRAMGNFFNNFLAPLPLAWKIPGLVILIVLVMVLSGYQIKTLVFSIGPSSNKSKTKRLLSKTKKALEETDGESADERGDSERRRRQLKISRKKSGSGGQESLPYPAVERDIFAAVK